MNYIGDGQHFLSVALHLDTSWEGESDDKHSGQRSGSDRRRTTKNTAPGRTQQQSVNEMASVSPPHQWPRGPRNELHEASHNGSIRRLLALLSDGSMDIDQGEDSVGHTPLMLASYGGHVHVTRILLDNGANVSIMADEGLTALHFSARNGHRLVSKMLMEAGADLEAATTFGYTPLHMAAGGGHLVVMDVLIDAGANPNSRRLGGSTPLYLAAQNGHKDAVKVLLRAKANPLLTRAESAFGRTYVPFDIAAEYGHLEVVRELMHQFGIEGCCGASGGVQALVLAAMNQHVDIMAALMEAGVVDNGMALAAAATNRREQSMIFLLQQMKEGDDVAAYVNSRDYHGDTPVLYAIHGSSPPSPRIVRLLVDAGADTRSAIRVTNTVSKTPLALVSLMLREKKILGKDATEEQLLKLKGTRRLLLRVEAIHAVSFLWPVDVPSIVAAEEGAIQPVASPTPLRTMLPILRRRARKPRMLLAALFRCVV